MGYRSEVAVAIKADFYTKLIEGISDNTEAIRSLISEAEVYKRGRGILLHWVGVKWYYGNVDKFEESLRAIDDEEWIMYEIGEELEDIKVCGHWWDNPFNLSVSRSLSFSNIE
jgi:hypothetical protein